MKLFTVGPTEMHPSTLEVGGRQVPYFRNQTFSDVMKKCESMMKHFVYADQNDKFILLTASGTAAMESVVINCFHEDDKILVINGGSFGQRFIDLFTIHGIDWTSIDLMDEEDLKLSHLSRYVDSGISALAVNVNETSIGKFYNLNMISGFCQANNIRLIVDAIGSFCADPIYFTDYGIDALIVSSQKGLALSPGLSFVILAEDFYESRVKGFPRKTLYLDYLDYVDNGKRGQTPFTPAVGIVFELYDRLTSIDESGGVESAIAHTRELAHDFRDRIGRENIVSIPRYSLSNALTPIEFHTNIAAEVNSILENDYGCVLNPCGGKHSEKMSRVGHMGSLQKSDGAALIAALVETVNKLHPL